MTPRGPEELPDEELRVAESRRRVEQRVADLRDAMRSDFGLVPRTAGWVLPALGFAVGFGLAVQAFRRRRALR
jgi:hypothetical protein